MRETEEQALSILTTWQRRLEELESLISTVGYEDCQRLFRHVKAAFGNFRVIAAQAEREGKNLFLLPDIKVRAEVCYEKTLKVDRIVSSMVESERASLRKIQRTVKNLSKFRSVPNKKSKSKFISSLKV